jgi:hypothetical protein
MKQIVGLLLIVTLITGACIHVPPEAIGLPAGMSKVKTPTPFSKTESTPRTIPLIATWQIQYTGKMDYSLDVNVYNLDLFDTDAAIITQLHERGIFVMCYFSAGTFEDWRPDAERFPPSVLGKDVEDWEGEKWLDIRAIETLKPIMSARLDIAAQKDCDGVDPDNVDGYANATGFPLSYDDQITYNITLATLAHERGLSIGLKNDLEQIPDLFPFFDWALNEECFSHEECYMLLPFVKAGKPVFAIEYNLTPEEFCIQANDINFNALQKNRELDGFRFSCR